VDVIEHYILRQWVNSHRDQGASWINAYHNPYLCNALVAIQENPAHPWQVEELAQRASLSRSAFVQRFKELLGATLVNYVSKVRIQKAMELLYAPRKVLSGLRKRWAMQRALRCPKPLSASPGCRRRNSGCRQRGDFKKRHAKA